MSVLLPGRSPWRMPSALRDIAAINRPEITVEQWDDRAQALAQISAWADGLAVEAINWYLRDKRGKRRASRLLRAISIVFAVTGGVLPLVSSSSHGVDPNLGYISLALAAGCVAFDHFFGLSSGWMRDIAAAQALKSRVARFRLEWVRWEAIQAPALRGADAEAVAEATDAGFELIRELVTDVAQITESETAQWIAEFSSSVAALRKEAIPSVTSPEDLFSWSSPADPT